MENPSNLRWLYVHRALISNAGGIQRKLVRRIYTGSDNQTVKGLDHTVRCPTRRDHTDRVCHDGV